MNKPKIILIGKNKNLLDLICFSLQTNFRFEIVRFVSILDVIEYMDVNTDFCLVISDFAIGEKQFSNTLKTFMDKKIDVPFFALGATKKFREKNENREVVSEYIGKKNILEDLNSAVEKYFSVDKSVEPKEFCEVGFSVLTSFEGLQTDLFIQLPTGRHLKIYRQEDQINDEDVSKYQGKGVDELFLHKKVSHWLLNTINKNIESVVDNIESNKPVVLQVEPPMPEVKVEEVVEEALDEKDLMSKLNEASEEENLNKIHKDINEIFEITEELEKELGEKVGKAVKAVQKVPHLSKLLKKLNVSRNGDDYCKSHVGLLCKLTTAICHIMDWKQDATIEKLVFVSYLHDITLSDFPHLARIQSKEELRKLGDKISPDEKKVFLEHPEVIKKLVDEMPEAPADASNIILQHHENCQGTGFPFGHSANRLLPLTAVFIIAHDLVSFIIDDPNWDMKVFAELASERYSGANFNKIVRKLKTLKLK
ncbi:hypothetical protein A9Q84_19860 [Halobacteriovorax marinus]|uniref:HD-GYP domain-containing protein n=1 Tax=Halobacteriovorax marinus TaxID=97084 RepID=A0A1Y5F975_9BACT|nr:hypothetical protein A9Q84_19860 [Halobacteriovorax marinus]